MLGFKKHRGHSLPLNNGELFLSPSHTRKVLSSFFWGVMLLTGTFAYSSYTIFVHLCEVEGKIPFSSSSMVLMIESSKLLTSVILFAPEAWRTGASLPSLSFCLPFAVPAFLYCINNNLAVHMQLHMDPATYQILSNMKVASTAVLYRLIIKRNIPFLQWISLGLLTIAGLSDSYGSFKAKGTTANGEMHVTLTGLVMMATYCLISSLAGVYSEYILKRHYSVSLHYQNILLYTFGIFVNTATWLSHESTQPDSGSRFVLFRGYSGYTWLIIFTQAANGLIMSVVLKHASNITRLFIISCAMLLTTVMSILVFSTQLNIFFVISVILVIFAMYLYYK